jgi:tetratricopeptide (TPR) repeat protein
MRWLALVLCLTQGTLARADTGPVAKAEAILTTLSGEHDTQRRFAIASEAQKLCEAALVKSPDDVRAHIVLGRSLTVADLEHPEACRPGYCQRAIDELKRARAVDKNGVEAEQIASELGIVLSRVGDFEAALGEYDRALGLYDSERRPNFVDENGDRAVLYGNSAETLMALGRLNEAIERYRLAEAAASPGDVEWELAEWGLAVALDRDEQVEKARVAVAEALHHDETMDQLSSEGVFFEPAGDKLYYLALGHEVADDRREAMKAWSDYLATQPRARWARRARAHLKALEKGPRLPPEAPPEVAFGEPMALQTELRSPEKISASLRPHLADVQLCYARALRMTRHPFAVVFKLQFEVTGPGYPIPHPRATDVSDADLQPDAMRATSELVHCVESTAKDWRFSPVGGLDAQVQMLLVPIVFGKQP